MPTVKQKKVARLIIANTKLKKPLNGKEIAVIAGYSKRGVIKTPSRIMESSGVKEELEALGFNEYSAKKVVEEIMLSKTTDASARLKATDQVFKVHGSYAPEKHKITGSLITADINNLSNEQLSRIVEGQE